MNIWIALRRIVAKHFLYHMVIPLAVGALAEVFLASRGPDRTLQAATADLLRFQLVLPVLAVICTYLIVMLLIITRETTTPFEIASFTKVEQQLQHATSYFALCAIPMREWFEPGAFKYFSLLLSKKQACDATFRYDRVIIVAESGQKRDAEATILDRYHAEALATAHRMLGIPMGWLRPTELRHIMRALKPEQRIVVQRMPKALRLLPATLVSRFPWPVQLDFAIVERPGGKVVIIVPFKKAEAMVLDGNDAAPYEALAEAVKGKVYEQDLKTVRLDHDFPRLLGIH